MFWVVATEDFIHILNRHNTLKRDLLRFKKGDSFLAFSKSGKVTADRHGNPVAETFYTINTHGYRDLYINAKKLKEIPLSADELNVAKMLFGD